MLSQKSLFSRREEFKVRIDQIPNGKCIYIGFTAGIEWYPNESHMGNRWFIDFWANSFGYDSFRNINLNDVITIIREGTKIKFMVNDIGKGIRFTNVSDKKLYPSAGFTASSQSLTLL